MNVSEVLAVFDEQMRRNPAPEPGTSVERDAGITRVVGPPGSWRGVTWSDLRDSDVGAVIEDQIERLTPYGDWEWKLYSYDQPTDPSDRLVAFGFVREADETVLVAALDELDLVASPPPGVELVPVVDGHGVDAVVAVHDEVSGGPMTISGVSCSPALRLSPPMWRRSSRWPMESRSQPAESSSQQSVISPISGVGARCQRGADADCSVLW